MTTKLGPAWASIQAKIQGFNQMIDTMRLWRKSGEQVVFTNGCFDILHYGHLHYLSEARDLGTKLVVGMNSGASVSRLKGPHRPINDELTRTHLMAGLQCVDAVVLFEEETPLSLITLLRPDVLVKGGDWKPEQIVGSELVLSYGGSVQSLPFIAGYSTTNIEQKILGRL
jgi:D-glycero-beta-D-manno-heptose 1-phosphate adenylyltransferase